jgi:hypothetical protein
VELTYGRVPGTQGPVPRSLPGQAVVSPLGGDRAERQIYKPATRPVSVPGEVAVSPVPAWLASQDTGSESPGAPGLCPGQLSERASERGAAGA